MALVDGNEYPEHLYCDLENQIWYEPLPDGTIRASFTPIAVALAGEVLVFAPKRIGRRSRRSARSPSSSAASGWARPVPPSMAWWWWRTPSWSASSRF
jgi:hypothetical protein